MWVMDTAGGSLLDPSEDLMLDTVLEAIRQRHGEIWIEHLEGPALGIVIGGDRAMILRLAHSDGDAGFHAVDSSASPQPSGEYVLANGQVDYYDDCDTIETRHVVPILTHFLATRDRWPGVAWQNDAGREAEA